MPLLKVEQIIPEIKKGAGILVLLMRSPTDADMKIRTTNSKRGIEGLTRKILFETELGPK